MKNQNTKVVAAQSAVPAPRARYLGIRLDRVDDARWQFVKAQYRRSCERYFSRLYRGEEAQQMANERTDADLFRAILRFAHDNPREFGDSLTF